MVRNIRNIADNIPFWQDKRNNVIIGYYKKSLNVHKQNEV